MGNLSRLELHHIFPKALLYKHDYGRPDANALANFTFLTQETNLRISDHAPERYLEEIVRKQPGALESHWIPMDRTLWKVENYLDFLSARRELLAKAANRFLGSLVAGDVPEAEVAPSVPKQLARAVPGGIGGEDEERLLRESNEWVVEQGLPEGEYSYELADPVTGEPLAILDLAWPDGLQQGLSQPVALLIDEDAATEEIVNRAGYRFFISVEVFRAYVRSEVLALKEVPA